MTVTSGARLLRAPPLRRSAAAPPRRMAGFELVALLFFLGCGMVEGRSGQRVGCGPVLGLPPPPLDTVAVCAAWLLVMGLWLGGTLTVPSRRCYRRFSLAWVLDAARWQRPSPYWGWELVEDS